MNYMLQAEGTAPPENPLPDITGVILVGGKSRRMGQDKAFLRIAGKTLFERVLAVFRDSFDKIVLVGDRAERFDGHSLRLLPDIYPGSSLGGLYTGLFHAETEYVFVASCDLPFPNSEVLRHLCSRRDGYDAVVQASARGYEPLFALYRKSCLGPIKELLESGDFCAYAWYPRVRVNFIPYEELAGYDRDGTAFLNVNTPEEFLKIGGEL